MNEVFSKLKQVFVTVPLLIQFNNKRETVIKPKVSIWCIGGILFQYADGVFRICAYYFEKKKQAGRMQLQNYNKKMLPIMHCFEKWDAELRNVKFEIRIDYKYKKYFMW